MNKFNGDVQMSKKELKIMLSSPMKGKTQEEIEA